MTDKNNATLDLCTGSGGRAYIADYFATQLRRHDFAKYINSTLAADFACALAQHLSKLRAEGVQAGNTLSTNEQTAITALVDCAAWAFHAADDGEDDGTDTIKVPRHAMPKLEAALYKMDTLPDDKPGCTMGPSGRAEWALRRFFGGTTIMGQEQQAAALASAPVAGEAQPVAWLLETTPDGYALHRSFDFDEPPTSFPGLVRKTALYAAPQASAEPLARYCPGCGSVGPVGDEYRDCCPDGNQARMIPKRLAEQCRETFRLAIQSLLPDVPANDGGAPEASEAVRILFPTQLRKMWSGGEVQAWLDNHQGITPPTASAKGSLERYRNWRAEQAEADKDGVRSEGRQ
ncbi:hypothetical protein [Achromobacter spanius]|uniref:Uncharacterized protein n=1 Tax=Achromobacter spanius TaxID=217203 RepID=A0AA42LVI4_9BURK|nr:hypothetical protein [Achromobacter spanius]MDH0740175.1 hypothetical protein [Achromobacter spanius]